MTEAEPTFFVSKDPHKTPVLPCIVSCFKTKAADGLRKGRIQPELTGLLSQA